MEKQNHKRDNNPYHIYYKNYLDTNACTACTGLMNTVAKDHEEWDAYREIFDFKPKPPYSDRNQD